MKSSKKKSSEYKEHPNRKTPVFPKHVTIMFLIVFFLPSRVILLLLRRQGFIFQQILETVRKEITAFPAKL